MKEETKTPRQILDQAQEEFDEKFILVRWMKDKYGDELFISDLLADALKSFLTSTLQSFISSEIAMLEGKKKPESLPPDLAGNIHSLPIHQGYNQALQNQISHLKGLLVTLKR